MKLYRPKSEGYPDVTWLVFNCSERDKKLARTAFIREYGPGRWEQFRNERLSTGIMELFHHPQDELAIFYANFIGKRVDERALRTAEKTDNEMSALEKIKQIADEGRKEGKTMRRERLSQIASLANAALAAAAGKRS